MRISYVCQYLIWIFIVYYINIYFKMKIEIK